MKKTFFKRAISLSLTLVMVLTMIPMGVIGTFADTTDAGYLVDNDNKAITITSAVGWNTVAQNSSSYLDYDITLGDHIDFDGVEFSVLFPATLSNGTPADTTEAYSGTFDGNGKTIKNVSYTSTSTTIGGAVIATVLSGTVKNLEIDNATFSVAAKGSAIVVGVLAGGTISDVTVKNSTLASSTNVVALFVGNTATSNDANLIEKSTIDTCLLTATNTCGGFVGSVAKSVNIENCSVIGNTAVTATTYGSVGMYVGKINSGPTVTIDTCSTGENVTVEYNGTSDLITTTNIDYARGVGLIVGQAGAFKTSSDWCDLIVKNCTVGGKVTSLGTVNNAKTNAYVGGVVGVLSSARDTNRFEKISVTAEVSGTRCVGGIIGCFYDNGSVTVNQCNVSGSVYDNSSGGSGVAGGILGEYTTADATGTINIYNSAVSATVTSNEKYCKGLGGVIGVLGRGSVSMDVTVNIENCYVSASLVSTTAKAGSIIGCCSAVGSTDITVDNIIVDVDTTNASKGCGLLYNTVTSNTTLTQSNIITTIKDSGDSSVIVVADNQIDDLITYENGYITSVVDNVRCNLVQVSNKNTNGTEDTSDDTYLVRFIGATLLTDIQNAHMVVTVTTSDGSRTFEADCTVYDTLTGYTDMGVETYKATDYAANKFVAIVIEDLPASVFENAEFTIDLTMTTGTGESEKTYDASFVGTLPLTSAA